MEVVTHAERRREIWREGVETRMRVSAATGAEQLCIFEQWVAPGTGAPTHAHPVEEVLTVLAGTAEIWIDDARSLVSAGQSAVVPAGRRHGLRNAGEEVLHVLAVLASPGFEAIFDGSDAPVRRWIG